MKSEIIFTGTIKPQTPSVTFDERSVFIKTGDRDSISAIKYSCNASLLTASAYFSNKHRSGPYADPDSLMFHIERTIQIELNIYNVTHGSMYSASIEEMNESENIYKRALVIPVISDYFSNNAETNEMIKILCIKHRFNGWYIQKSIVDLNLAMLHAMDTGFFCYRAIETLIKYFCNSMADSIKPRHLKQFLKRTNSKRSDFELLKSYADDPRHGWVVSISSEERALIFTAAWNIFTGFLDFASRDYDNIESSFERDTMTNSNE